MREEEKTRELKMGMPHPDGTVRVQPCMGGGGAEVEMEGRVGVRVRWVRRMGIRSS